MTSGAVVPGARRATAWLFSGLRQLEWLFTTPVLPLLVQNLHVRHAFAGAAAEGKA